MAVAFRSATNNTRIGVGNLLLNVPAGVQNGDILIAMVIVGSASNLPGTPAGWTAIDGVSATGPSAQTYYRVAASEPASYTFAVNNDAAGAISAYTGGNTTTPINAHSAFNRLTSTTATATTITTTVDGCMLIFVVGCGTSQTTYTGPTSYNQRATPTSNVSCELADFFQTTQGATGSVSATLFAGVNNQSSLIAIAPAAVAVSDAPSDRRTRRQRVIYR